MTHAHICRHGAGLDELTQRQQAQDEPVLLVLYRQKRFSVFEATHNGVIARKLDSLQNRKMFIRTGGAFPWCEVELTEAGLAVIATAIRAGEGSDDVLRMVRGT